MNEITLLREAGPEGPPLSAATRSAARAALLDEIAATRPRRRLVVRPPRRRTALRVGAGLVTAAAVWTTAVVVAPEDDAPPRDQVGVDGVTLVDFAMPAAPLTLPTAPEGTSGPLFGADGTGGTSMAYDGVADPTDRLSVSVAPRDEPVGEGAPDGSAVVSTGSVAGVPARVVVMNPDDDLARHVYVEWERLPGQWVLLMGSGRFADVDVLSALGAELVDRPQEIPVQIHLAPAGYSLDVMKVGGRFLRLADDADPARTRGMSVTVLDPADVATAEFLASVVAGAASVEDVLVLGQPASLARVDSGGFHEASLADGGWLLQARFPDGTAFVLEAPGTLTREQVLQIADGVTHTP